MKLEILQEAEGVFVVTSPDVPGLLAVSRDPAEALTKAWAALGELAEAGCAYAQKEMKALSQR